MQKRTIVCLLALLFTLGAALPARALSEPTLTYDAGTVTEGLMQAIPGMALTDSTSGNTLGFADAPKMSKYRFALPKDETLTLYYYASAAEKQLAKSFIDGYALTRNGEVVYAATELPYTWYADDASALLLYCGADKAVNKALRAFTNNAPVGGYFAGDTWVQPYAVVSTAANATVHRQTPVYGGANTKYEKLGSLRVGTRVEVLGRTEDGQWANIRADDRWACVPMNSLQSDAGLALPILIPTTDGGNVGNGRMTATVNVRTGPGTGYNKLRKVKKGTVVAVDETQGDWARLRYDNSFGPLWANIKYIAWEAE